MKFALLIPILVLFFLFLSQLNRANSAVRREKEYKQMAEAWEQVANKYQQTIKEWEQVTKNWEIICKGWMDEHAALKRLIQQ